MNTIRQMVKSDIIDVAECHILSWKAGFENILSEKILDNLSHSKFEENWQTVLQNKSRKNLVYLENEKSYGFISFGSSKTVNKNILNEGEIYGIYVHPERWGTGVANNLLRVALEHLKEMQFSQVILWTMTKNERGRSFYQKEGFRLTSNKRISEREDESFEEVKYVIETNQI